MNKFNLSALLFLFQVLMLNGEESVVCNAFFEYKEIHSHTPALIRVDLENKTNKDITLSQPLGIEYGTVKIEIRGSSEDSFRVVKTKYSDLKNLFGYRGVIEPQSKLSVIEFLLMDSEGNFVFDNQGEYQFRFKVLFDGQEISSPIVKVEVTALPTEKKEKIISLKEELQWLSLNSKLSNEMLEIISAKLNEIQEYSNILKYQYLYHSIASENIEDKNLLEACALERSSKNMWELLFFEKLLMSYNKLDKQKTSELLKGIAYKSYKMDSIRKEAESR